jgi:hypothetical protein
MMITVKVSRWTICDGHTITRTHTGDSTYMNGASAYKFYEWQTDVTCTCGWVVSHNSKLSNKVVTDVHMTLHIETAGVQS